MNILTKQSPLLLTFALLVLSFFAGCSSQQNDVASVESTQQIDASPTAQLMIEEALSEKIENMNIELWDPSGVDAFADATVGSGILDFSDGCGLLALEDGFSVLLVWPKPTAWNSETQSIEYISPQGDKVVLQDGDEIIPGGMSSDGRELDTDCEADEVFVISELRLVTSP